MDNEKDSIMDKFNAWKDKIMGSEPEVTTAKTTSKTSRKPSGRRTASTRSTASRSSSSSLSTAQKKAAWKKQISKIRETTGPKVIATHEVGVDDTLSHIALKYYKNAGPDYYNYIWQYNRALLGDSADNTKPGMIIKIPELSKKLKGTFEPKVPKGFMAIHSITDHNDMLSKIALKYYGNGTKDYYMWIYEANIDLLGDSPDNTRYGMDILIPELPKELLG